MNDSKQPGKNALVRLVGVLIFLVALLAVFRFSGLSEHVTLMTLHQRFVEDTAVGMLLFVVFFSLGNLVQVPGWIFLAAAVLALGQVWGGVATYVAAVVSCAVTYGVIRLVGGDALRKIRNPWAQRLLSQLHARPVRSMALLRVLLQTLPALNYALALSGVTFADYMLAAVLGLPLPIAAYCLLFETLAKLLHIAVY